MAPQRLNKRPAAALAAVGLGVARTACTATEPGPGPETARPPDPGYDASSHLQAQYADAPECLPRIAQPGFVATLMAEPGTCPAT